MKRLLLVLFIAALAAPAAFSSPSTTTGPASQVAAVPIAGLPAEGGLRLWVHVFPERGGKGKPKPSDGADACSDVGQSTTVPRFAKANAVGLDFEINQASIPIDQSAATQAIEDALQSWNAVEPGYFSVSATGGAARPAADGTNSVGWAKLAPRSALAAAWTWTDANGRIVEADIFFNSLHSWGVLAGCNAASLYDVENVAAHEVGHTVGLDHLSDSGKQATMYPSAPRGEVKKRTLTAGDVNGFLAALAP